MEITESKLFTEYPMAAPTAYSYSLTYEDVRELIKRMENNLGVSRYFQSTKEKEMAIKSILMRVDLNRDDFYKHLELRKQNIINDEELSKESGRYYLEAYKAILK